MGCGTREHLAAIQQSLARCHDLVARRVAVLAALDAGLGDVVLEVGCGGGIYLREIATAVGEQGRAFGNDVSADQVAAARQYCDGLTNVTIETGDLAALAIADETVDAVVAVQVLEYVAEVDRALSEIRRVTRPGGRLVNVATNWAALYWTGWRPVAHERAFPFGLADNGRAGGTVIVTSFQRTHPMTGPAGAERGPPRWVAVRFLGRHRVGMSHESRSGRRLEHVTFRMSSGMRYSGTSPLSNSRWLGATTSSRAALRCWRRWMPGSGTSCSKWAVEAGSASARFATAVGEQGRALGYDVSADQVAARVSTATD